MKLDTEKSHVPNCPWARCWIPNCLSPPMIEHGCTENCIEKCFEWSSFPQKKKKTNTLHSNKKLLCYHFAQDRSFSMAAKGAFHCGSMNVLHLCSYLTQQVCHSLCASCTLKLRGGERIACGSGGDLGRAVRASTTWADGPEELTCCLNHVTLNSCCCMRRFC